MSIHWRTTNKFIPKFNDSTIYIFYDTPCPKWQVPRNLQLRVPLYAKGPIQSECKTLSDRITYT